MDTAKLIATGLNKQQALAYALLIRTGGVKAPDAADKLNLSRSNAYKVLDSLTQIGLAKKEKYRKTLIYSPTNPTNLTTLAAKQRNIATDREAAVQEVMSELLEQYRGHTDKPNTKISAGRQAVAEAFLEQAYQKDDIYFIRSSSDIPVMGFETMRKIRTEPERKGVKRHGITPDSSTNPKDSILDRTWVKSEDYNVPVEWSVAGESLLIVVFMDRPYAITIESPVIAEAFRQIWALLSECLQAMPYYENLPR